MKILFKKKKKSKAYNQLCWHLSQWRCVRMACPCHRANILKSICALSLVHDDLYSRLYELLVISFVGIKKRKKAENVGRDEAVTQWLCPRKPGGSPTEATLRGDWLAGVHVVPPRTAHPLLPGQTEDWWRDGRGLLGGEVLGEMSGEKLVAIRWTRIGGCCRGNPANSKVGLRRIQFGVFTDRFID